MHHLLWFSGVLLIGVFLTLPISLDGSAICDEKRSVHQGVSRQITRTLQVATYYKCWLFWRCTTYRTAIGYRVSYQLVTKYFTIPVCCEGYEGDAAQNACHPIRGPDENLSTTENPSLNQTSETGEPDIAPVRNETKRVGSPQTTPSPPIINFPSSTTQPSNGTARADGLGMISSKARRQALIMISLIIFFVVVIVFSLVLGCVVYRRRRGRRVQRKVDSLHMEPLRDFQPLSETTSHIQHFSPPSAPNDEYAIPDKAPKAQKQRKDAPQTYENTNIDGRPLAHQSNAKDQAKPEGNRLTHTYMDGFVYVETKKEIVPVSMEATPDNEVDEMPTSTAKPEECYTEVDDMPSRSVVADAEVQDHKYYYTKFDTSSPSTNECYAEVHEMQPSSADLKGAVRDEYEAVGDMQLTYDHLDRSSTTGNPDAVNSSKEGSGNAGGKYGVLVQASSVESQESYDAFQRSVSQTEQSGVDGYEPLLAVPSKGSTTEQSVATETYDDLDRMPKTQKKGKNLLEKLRQSTNTTAYGHLGSSFESDISETDHPVMEAIYSNQDAEFAGARESTYTDMSGSRSNSVLIRDLSFSSETDEVVAYTEMSPIHRTNNYYNVDLENIHESIE